MLLWKRTTSTTFVGTLITFIIITNSNFNYVNGKEDVDGDGVDEGTVFHFVDYPIQRFTEWDNIQDAF